MKIQIAENDLKGFNQNAKGMLKQATNEFIGNLIEESNRVEASRNTISDQAEITSSMVNDAKILIRQGLVKPKTKLGIKILRISAAVLSISTGLLYDTEKLQNTGYMVFFILFITVTILAVTISTIKE